MAVHAVNTETYRDANTGPYSGHSEILELQMALVDEWSVCHGALILSAPKLIIATAGNSTLCQAICFCIVAAHP